MITRLNRNTFKVKFMNIMQNTFSFSEYGRISISKCLCMSCSSIGKNSFMKFNQLIADRLFMMKKRSKLFQNWIQRFSRYSPTNLVTSSNVFAFSIDEMNMTSETFSNPEKNWTYRIVQLQGNFINFVWSVSWFVVLYTKTAFCINKASQINKIFFSWFNRFFNKSKFFKSLFSNKLQMRFSMKENFFEFGSIAKFRLNDINVSLALASFFDKIGQNIYGKFTRIFSMNNPMMTWLLFSSFSFFGNLNITPKNFCKIDENIQINGCDIYFTVGFTSICSYIKTSISIDVASNVDFIYNSLINHAIQNSLFKSYQATVSDNPTELTYSDIIGVVRELRTNNSYEFMEGIGGENKFGTSPVRDAYIAMGSTMLQGQFENIPQFTYKWNYPSVQSTMPSEYGSVANVRFLLSSIGAVLPNASANGADVYPLIVAGRESYCIVEQDRYSSQFVYRPPIFSGPLALNATVGYKLAWAGVITNDAWVFLLNSTLST